MRRTWRTRRTCKDEKHAEHEKDRRGEAKTQQRKQGPEGHQYLHCMPHNCPGGTVGAGLLHAQFVPTHQRRPLVLPQSSHCGPLSTAPGWAVAQREHHRADPARPDRHIYACFSDRDGSWPRARAGFRVRSAAQPRQCSDNAENAAVGRHRRQAPQAGKWPGGTNGSKQRKVAAAGAPEVWGGSRLLVT